MSRSLISLSLLLFVAACGASVPAPAPPTSSPAMSPTTIVMIVTVPPVPTVARPSPIAAPVIPTAVPVPERELRLTSDGVSSPPGFRLAGGDYLFAWEVPRPTGPAGCYFGALLTSEPSVQPFTLQTLGPWTVEPTAGHTGSRRIDGLGAGGYTLRPNGDCPWAVTITPIRDR